MCGYSGYQNLLDSLIRQSREILGEQLLGIYLHGSAAMGCFHAARSDIDLLTVVERCLSSQVKRRYMDMIVSLHRQAPGKGIEISAVKASVCRPFVYPTPFELHFSAAHLDWYLSDPEDYVAKMRGTDRDLAAHFMVTYHRGITLYGKEIRDVFSQVGDAEYWDSIWRDIEHAEEEIAGHFVYMTLNLCRVLAYKKARAILSKQEGGRWGLANVPSPYAGLISAALMEYQTGQPAEQEGPLAMEYARYMLGEIKAYIDRPPPRALPS